MGQLSASNRRFSRTRTFPLRPWRTSVLLWRRETAGHCHREVRKDSRLQKQGLLEFKWGCLHQALNRLCTYAERHGENLIVIMDTENEKERVVQVQNSYAHVFNRTADPDHGEMRRLIESTIHVDSQLSANVQFADWVAAAVRRAFEYQLIEDSPFSWVPTAFEDLTRSKLTIESKLYFSHSRGGVREVHNSGIFARERPALAMSIS